MKRNIKLLVLTLFIACLSPRGAEASANPERIFGYDRVETSVKVSQKAYKSSKTVVLAGFGGQVDSLSGTILAHDKNAPMLLTRKDALDKVTLDEIKRLKAEEIYILGGENVVSKAVEDSLAAYKVTRVSGKKREETAVNIAEKVVGARADEVFLTLGYDEYADALAIGPVSGRQKKPIFLTKTKEISKDTKDALKSFGVKKVTIIGGQTVVSKSVENELTAMGISFERVFGDNRMETALKIAERYTANPDSIIVANAYKYADAVIGGYLAAKENAPILLSRDKLIDIKSLDYIAKNGKQTYILGGEKVIYNPVYGDIEFVLTKNWTIKDEEKNNFNENGVIKNIVERVYYKDGQRFAGQVIKESLAK